MSGRTCRARAAAPANRTARVRVHQPSRASRRPREALLRSRVTVPNVNGLESERGREGHMEIKKVVVREEEAKNRERQTIEKRPTR